jgi:hypothetical protein
MVKTWPGHGQNMAWTWSKHGQDMVKTWPGHGQNMARTGPEQSLKGGHLMERSWSMDRSTGPPWSRSTQEEEKYIQLRGDKIIMKIVSIINDQGIDHKS